MAASEIEAATAAARAQGIPVSILSTGVGGGRDTFFDAVRATLPLDPPLSSNYSWDALSDSLFGGLYALGVDRVLLIWTDAAEMAAAVSKDAIKAMGREIRSWHIARRSDKSLGDLARMFNSIVQGWINYYGRFYKSMLYPLLRRINEHLVRWAKRKYKRLRRRETRVRQLLAEASRRSPRLFAHWRIGLKPDGWTMGAR